MALAVVSMCLTSVGSCGSPFRRAVFPSGSGVIALPGMEAARRGRIGLACKAVAGDGGRVEALTGHLVLFGDGATPGGRATVACEAAGIHGGDSPLDPMASLPKQLESAAKKTLLMLNQVELPKDCSCPVRRSVSLELGELRAGCEGLMEELAAGRISGHEASITLLGLHGRVDILLSLWRGGNVDDKGRHVFPGSLEASSDEALRLSMRQTEFMLEQANYLKKDPEQDQNNVRGPSAATQSFTELINTLAKKTIFLLAEVTEIHLSKDATSGERMSVSLELDMLRDSCDKLAEEVVKAQVSDHAAIGALLGIHARFRVVFMCCIDVRGHGDLEASIKEALMTTMTDTEQRVKHYVETEAMYAAHQETNGEAAEEVE